MKLIIELPDNLLDMDSFEFLGFLNEKMKDTITREVKEQLFDKYLAQYELTDLGITKKELRKAVIEKMAEKAVEKLED